MDPADLYGLPLDRFIPERGALAKELRAEGRRDEAAEVAKLRKPSVAAWAVNQVVRTQGKALRELYEAGDALRKAQTDLLEGKGDPRALRTASRRERAAVERLVEAARGLLTSDGHELSPAVLDRVTETLNAAALDDDAREHVREGTLARELRHVGFGLGEGELAAATPASARERKKPEPAAKGQKAAQGKRKGRGKPAAKETKASARDREAEREQAALRREERRKARDSETAARRRIERAQRALKAVQERHDRAAGAFAKAEEALAEARAEAESALAEHELAKSRLEAAATD